MMSKTEAKEWVRGHGDDDPLEEDELWAAFSALAGREVDPEWDDTSTTALWSECVLLAE